MTKNSIKNSDISIILLLYKTPINKLQNLKNYKDFNVLILDQSNDQIIKKEIDKLLPNIVYYKLSNINRGFAKGINFLSKKVKTKYFLCTQIDVIIDKKSIIELKKAFLKNKDCAISIPNLNFSKKLNKNSKSICKTTSFIGAIFLTEKLKFSGIGKFDENFFFYWEDQDLSKRLEISKKYNIYKCYNSLAKHINGNSTIVSNKSKFIRLTNFKFGEYYYQNKYRKLKKVKMIREPILRIILMFFSIIFFKKDLFYKNLFFLIGILKYYKFMVKK